MIILPREKASAKKARDHIVEIAESWPVDIDDVRLVASELATNAIRHAKSEKIRVDAYSRMDSQSMERLYVVEVWDGDQTLPTQGGEEAAGDGGWGLLMMSLLAFRWGARHVETGGKIVYAEWTCP
ncbi:ATP-binding protein [Actinomadura sp. 9N215]|uniref:ATP-binding protein n=1 Tax=Actinomadura sp. 9N215 TaxID=3375150 RepID=UPI0037A7EE3B